MYIETEESVWLGTRGLNQAPLLAKETEEGRNRAGLESGPD